MRISRLSFALAFCLSAGIQAKQPSYAEVSESSVDIDIPIGQLRMTDTVVQEGAVPLNRFTMHRLRRLNYPYRGTLLLLPSLGNNFSSYLMHESGDVTKSFAATFARLGYEVWGYSPRETGIDAGACGGAIDCSPALQWSLQTILDDAGYIRERIKKATPDKAPVVGGLSLGAISATALVNQNPKDYAGLLVWEGSIVTDDPAIRAHNLNYCNQVNGLVAAGVPVDDQSLPFVKAVAQLAGAAPNDPFAIPVPGFPPGLTNLQAFVLIMATPNPVAPSPRPGFISAAGDFSTGQLFFSNPARLIASIATFNDATANRTLGDVYCGLASVDTKHFSNLSKYKGPVMIIKGGAGFGSILDELPAKLGSTAVNMVSNNSYGHVDHLGSSNHWLELELPIAQWLNQVLP